MAADRGPGDGGAGDSGRGDSGAGGDGREGPDARRALRTALGRLTGDDLRRLREGLGEREWTALCRHILDVQRPRSVPPTVLLQRVRGSAGRPAVLGALTAPVFDTIVTELGEEAGDPTPGQLAAAAVVADRRWGPALVDVVLWLAVVEGLPARASALRVLDDRAGTSPGAAGAGASASAADCGGDPERPGSGGPGVAPAGRPAEAERSTAAMGRPHGVRGPSGGAGEGGDRSPVHEPPGGARSGVPAGEDADSGGRGPHLHGAGGADPAAGPGTAADPAGGAPRAGNDGMAPPLTGEEPGGPDTGSGTDGEVPPVTGGGAVVGGVDHSVEGPPQLPSETGGGGAVGGGGGWPGGPARSGSGSQDPPAAGPERVRPDRGVTPEVPDGDGAPTPEVPPGGGEPPGDWSAETEGYLVRRPPGLRGPTESVALDPRPGPGGGQGAASGGVSPSPTGPGGTDAPGPPPEHGAVAEGRTGPAGGPAGLVGGEGPSTVREPEGSTEGRAGREGTDEVLDEVLYEPLDALLIRTTVATLTGEEGAPPPGALRSIIDTVLHLNTARARSYFHAGYLGALRPDLALDLAEEGLNDERRTWLVFGRLSGLVRTGDLDGLRAVAQEHPGTVGRIVCDPRMGWTVTGPVVRSLLGTADDRAATLLALRVHAVPDGPPVPDWPALVLAVHERARSLLAEDRPEAARELWQALADDPAQRWRNVSAVGPWAQPLDVDRRLVSCLRREGRFTDAADLLERIPVPAAGPARAALLTERALVAMRVPHISALRPGAASAEAEVARIGTVRDQLEEAVRLDPDEWRARWCLGILALAEGDHEAAATHLAVVAERTEHDEVSRRTGLHLEARFQWARARLATLSPGDDQPAGRAVLEVVEAGYRPRPGHARDVVDALAAHGSRLTDGVLAALVAALPDPHALVDVVAENAGTGTAEALDAARTLAGDRRLEPDIRARLLAEVACRSLDDDIVADALEALDGIVGDSMDPDLDRLWIDVLAHHRVREVIGVPAVDLDLVEALARAGRTAEAWERLQILFHRAASGEWDLDPVDLLGHLEDLGASAEQLRSLRDRLPAGEPGAVTGIPDRGVTVVFVGGNETQAAYRPAVDAHVADRYGGRVRVRWHLTGWTANWGEQAARIEADLVSADVLVVMTFVRTMLGRRLRRSAGERGVPWRACTGHGRDSIMRAIDRAVAAVVGPSAT